MKISADLELSVAFHEAFTIRPANNDPNSELLLRFGVQCIDAGKWSLHQKELFEILDLPRVLEKIVETNGCVVHGEALRNGHRARRLDGKGILKSP